MNIYDVKENLELGSNKLDINEVATGRKYRLTGHIERGMYKGKLNTYFIESVYNKVLLMTRPDGSKPFAIATNDCERDGFNPFELSKILVEQGNYVIYGFQHQKGINYLPMQFMAFRVTNVHPSEKFDIKSIEVEATHKFDALGIPPVFEEVTDHAVSVLNSDLSDQLIPKYCFNPNRLISLRLFEKDDMNDVYSYHENNRLILNANSKERRSGNKIIPGAIMRVFYSRKFKDSKHIFVDGKALTPLYKHDLESYIENSGMDIGIARSIIREIITKNGQTYYGVTNLSDELRIIYKSVNGFSSFPLNQHEEEMLAEVNMITSWD